MAIAERFGQLSGDSLRERRGAASQLDRRQWLVEGQLCGDHYGVRAPDRGPATGDAAVDKVEAKRQSHDPAQRPVEKKPKRAAQRKFDRSQQPNLVGHAVDRRKHHGAAVERKEMQLRVGTPPPMRNRSSDRRP